MRGWVFGGLIALAGSTALVVCGAFLQLRRWQRVTLISVGVIGFLLSAGWLLLGAHIDAIES